MAWSTTINSSESQNPGGNTSTVYVSLTFSAINQGYSGYSTSFVLYVGGNLVANAGGPSALNTDGVGTDSWTSSTYSYTYTHNDNGVRGSVGTSGTFYGQGGYSPPSGGVGGTGTTYAAIDYDRKPAVPAAPTVVVNSDKTISLSWSAVSSPAGTATYYIQYAAAVGGGGYGAWSSEVSTTSTNYLYSGLARATTYKFRVRAQNSDGNSGYGAETSGYFLPAGGKIYENGAWRLLNFAKRFDGVNWVDLTIAKRFDGTNWIDLT